MIDQTLEEQRRLVQALLSADCYAHPVERLSLIETHISFVILTGTFVYKIKKAVDLGFLDFTTLPKRRFFCEEELRLNRRLAPRLYLSVVPIYGPPDSPKVSEGGQVIEYAVKMLEFSQDALADRMVPRGLVTARDMDRLARMVAEFHASLQPCGQGDDYGAPDSVRNVVAENFTQIRALDVPGISQARLASIEEWSMQEHARLRNVFAQRKRDGRVRECHGDLHTGNIAFLAGEPCVFDCIEFNPRLRWIDVMNEVAFLVMDLRAAGRPELAARFLNTYLESTGDYAGLCTLRFFVAYRAMVRAKVGLLRSRELGPGSQATTQQNSDRYLDLAENCARAGHCFIVITHGLSGSGKTTLSQSLVDLTGSVRIRSDVERKRMHGTSQMDRPKHDVAAGLYAMDVTDATYQRLLELAAIVVDSGYGVIVDATFLKQRHRDLFRALAKERHIPFAVVDFRAPEDVLRERIGSRIQEGRDASDADLKVLEYQLRTQEPLVAEELGSVFPYDASQPADEARRVSSWASLMQRLLVPAG